MPPGSRHTPTTPEGSQNFPVSFSGTPFGVPSRRISPPEVLAPLRPPANSCHRSAIAVRAALFEEPVRKSSQPPDRSTGWASDFRPRRTFSPKCLKREGCSGQFDAKSVKSDVISVDFDAWNVARDAWGVVGDAQCLAIDVQNVAIHE